MRSISIAEDNGANTVVFDLTYRKEGKNPFTGAPESGGFILSVTYCNVERGMRRSIPRESRNFRLNVHPCKRNSFAKLQKLSDKLEEISEDSLLKMAAEKDIDSLLSSLKI